MQVFVLMFQYPELSYYHRRWVKTDSMKSANRIGRRYARKYKWWFIVAGNPYRGMTPLKPEEEVTPTAI